MENKVAINHQAIGQRIREGRESLDLSREKFAEIIGLSDYYIGQLERGERQMSLPVLVKIANCLHISLDYLIFGKISHPDNAIYETYGIYQTYNHDPDKEIEYLLNKCSLKELELFKKTHKNYFALYE